MAFDRGRQEPIYRQMELNPNTADGEMHSPSQVVRQMEDARQKAEYYEAQRVQWEEQRQALEENNQKKALMNDVLDDVGMKLHNVVRRMDAELNAMKEECAFIERAKETLTRHLQILSSMQPKNWSNEGFQERYNEARPRIERAENDLKEAYFLARQFRHTDLFKHLPDDELRPHPFWHKIREQLASGLAFHLPLFLLLLFTWGIYTLLQA